MMKRKKNFLLIFMAAAAVFASCSDDAEEPDEAGEDETIPSANLKSLSLKIQNYECISFETETHDYAVPFAIVQAGSELILEAKPKWNDARLTITVDGAPFNDGDPLYAPPASSTSTIDIHLETDDASNNYQIILTTGATSVLDEAFEWLSETAQNRGEYTIALGQDEKCGPRTLSAATLNKKKNITITLKGDGAERVIQLEGTGALFTVDTGITLVLGENLTLKGAAQNQDALVVVWGGALVIEDGAKVTGNESSVMAGGIDVKGAGTLTLKGGEITGNTGALGGGIALYNGAYLTMTGGSITNNSALLDGGGIYLHTTSTLKQTEIRGGSITDNTAQRGGGIYLLYANLTIEEISVVPPQPQLPPPPTVISGNTANGADPQSGGGGIYIEQGGVTFKSGTIENNYVTNSAANAGSYNLYGLSKFSNQSVQILDGATGFTN